MRILNRHHPYSERTLSIYCLVVKPKLNHLQFTLKIDHGSMQLPSKPQIIKHLYGFLDSHKYLSIFSFLLRDQSIYYICLSHRAIIYRHFNKYGHKFAFDH